MSDLYWIHQLKRNTGVSEEDCESGLQDTLKPLWIQHTGCKDVILVKGVELPWSPGSKSSNYDYLWISVWDKEEHRKFIEKGGPGMPSMQVYFDKAKEMNISEMAGSLGAVEAI